MHVGHILEHGGQHGAILHVAVYLQGPQVSSFDALPGRSEPHQVRVFGLQLPEEVGHLLVVHVAGFVEEFLVDLPIFRYGQGHDAGEYYSYHSYVDCRPHIDGRPLIIASWMIFRARQTMGIFFTFLPLVVSCSKLWFFELAFFC